MQIFREYKNKNSLRRKKTRMLQGGETEQIGRNFLGWWERRDLGTDPSEILFSVTKVYARNPDLIAFDMYRDSGLGWIILQYNNIVDINEELEVGKQIRIPSQGYVTYNILTKPRNSNRQLNK